MKSMKEIAKLAGVSISTVSRALTRPEKVSSMSLDKIKKVLDEIDYPSQRVIQKHPLRCSRIVTVILADKYDPHFFEIIQGIIDTAKEYQYQILFGYLTRQQPPTSLEQLLFYKYSDGLILLCGQLPFECEDLSNFPPTVMAYEHTTNLNIPAIHIDNLTAAYNVVNYLMAIGHTRIAEMSTCEPLSTYQLSHQGYVLSFTRKGLKVCDNYLIKDESSFEGGASALIHLLDQEFPPTAIFCHTDLMAIGAIKQAQNLGLKIPDDISIVGFDNTPFAAYCEPALTTMSQPRYQIGQESMLTLINLMQGKIKHAKSKLFNSTLVERDSVASPRVIYKTNILSTKSDK